MRVCAFAHLLMAVAGTEVAVSGGERVAIVTLVTSNEYTIGAVALGYSLTLVGSTLERIALVTHAIEPGMRDSLKTKGGWALRRVAEIPCNPSTVVELDPAFNVNTSATR